MMVSNHSGGTTIPDVWGFGIAWYDAFSVDRPIHPMAHEIVMSTKATARFFSRRGVLRAGRGVASDVLTNWRRDLLVMPGGDVDTWRPYKDRYKVRFDGRKGYARTAIKAGVPIVPVAHAGAHSTLLVLSDGRRMAKFLKIKQLARANVWPIHLSFPWGLTIGPWPHIPTPANLRYRFGDPIDPPALANGEEPSQAAIDELDAAVRAAIQQMLNGLRDEDHR